LLAQRKVERKEMACLRPIPAFALGWPGKTYEEPNHPGQERFSGRALFDSLFLFESPARALSKRNPAFGQELHGHLRHIQSCTGMARHARTRDPLPETGRALADDG